jgi:hypothetical protein
MTFSNFLPDLPFLQSAMAETFQTEHELYLGAFPGWSLQRTRRKLAAFY